eukprot:TRINITY_DN2689_c0_g1_i1.p1 TRINITY_DN2689_c0_g1~~TRINITY_DN2689_c0_g1_i1.p1  ORF type:complete len:213 (-),score=41.18 TRINITY_DN2689_c0_g1_i1:10-648(-)
MVFYFTICNGRRVYMGRDKFENEELLRWGWPEDVWFHVDQHSSAHVYLRLEPGETVTTIDPAVLEDCFQLVKANSIEGSKLNNVDIVYTPFLNLKKTAAMDVGEVGYHDLKKVYKGRVHSRNTEILNRLKKTKVEASPDLQAEREARDAAERAKRHQEVRERSKQEKAQALERQKLAEMRSYAGLMDAPTAPTNKDLAATYATPRQMEEDFM